MKCFPFVSSNFLGPDEIERVRGAMGARDLVWQLDDRRDTAARGSAYRLDARSPTASAYVVLLKAFFATRVFKQIQDHDLWPARRRPAVQCFAVRLVGNKRFPSFQAPHTDTSSQFGTRAPRLSSVYYFQVQGVVGGELELFLAEKATRVLEPTENTLVVFEGPTPHAVRPLTAGERISVVTNFFA